MKPSVKYAVIYRHRIEYPVTVMCNFFGVSRSGYYSFVNRLGKPIKETELIEKIGQQQRKCFDTYGYRRMWQTCQELSSPKGRKSQKKIAFAKTGAIKQTVVFGGRGAEMKMWI